MNLPKLDEVNIFAITKDPYKLPEKLGFNLSKAAKYAKENKIKICEIPLDILKNLK